MIIHITYIYFIINSFISGAIWTDQEYEDFGPFRWAIILLMFMIAGSVILSVSWIKRFLDVALEWLDDKTCIGFWFKYIFMPRTTRGWTEDSLWNINHEAATMKFQKMEKKTFQAKCYLAALDALNKRNGYQP